MVIEKGKNLYELLNALYQGIRRLFVLAYVVAAGAVNDEAGIKGNRKYFLPRGEINNYNVLIDGRNFYDQPINDLIKQYDEVRKVLAGHGNDYTTGSLLDYAYFRELQIKQTKSFRCRYESNSTNSISRNCCWRC